MLKTRIISVKLSLLIAFFETNASQPFCLEQWASGKELISWATGGANVCTHVEYMWVWFWSYHVGISSCRWSLESKQVWKKSLCHFPCLVLHWTCYHSVSDSVHSFKRLASQVGYCYSMAFGMDNRPTILTGNLGIRPPRIICFW